MFSNVRISFSVARVVSVVFYQYQLTGSRRVFSLLAGGADLLRRCSGGLGGRNPARDQLSGPGLRAFVFGVRTQLRDLHRGSQGIPPGVSRVAFAPAPVT